MFHSKLCHLLTKSDCTYFCSQKDVVRGYLVENNAGKLKKKTSFGKYILIRLNFHEIFNRKYSNRTNLNLVNLYRLRNRFSWQPVVHIFPNFKI